MRVYLCGPINGCADEECKDWRKLVQETGGFDCVDPMKRDYRGREAESVREIVELDKRDIRGADALLVAYDKPSVGTAMEIFYAWTIGTPVIVVARADAALSPWLRYHATKIVHSFADAISWLRWALA
jgi:nucleoside 2-deoxyribosyltransferase